MPKISVIGAGSFFTNDWIRDVLLIPGLDEGTFALVDIDEERLSLAHEMAERIVEKMGGNWEVESSTNREELMPGTDYLINTIEVSGVETVEYDYEIPKKYGVDQCVGDTVGPGGIMKAMRTIPSWLEILKGAERLCSDALVLNYTNPMHMMTLAAERASEMSVVGLCHSVQGTSKQLAEYAGVPYEEMKWECAGINHMSWFTKLTHDGKDLYPVLKERAKNPEIYEKDPVRFEMMLQFGYFVTESSGHFSEYLPYFRKRPDLLEKYSRNGYGGESGFYAKNWPEWRKEEDELRDKLKKGEKSVDETINLSERSEEYGSYIVEAHAKGDPAVIHGNVLNRGLIDNLPYDGVVEVPVLVDENGFHPCKFGRLPEQLAALNRSNMTVHILAVKSILESDRESAIRAFMLDPLTAAVCSPAEIRDMAEELFDAEREYLPDFLFG